MSDEPKKIKIVDSYLMIPIDITPKGVKTFVLDLDDNELIETGTREKEKNGVKVPSPYYKFRIIEPKAK